MVRVLNIIGSLNMGGAQALIVNLYRNIDRGKIQFDFAVYDKPDRESYYDEVKKLGARVYYIPHKCDGVMRNQKMIYDIIKKNNYSIIWRHTSGCFGGLDIISAKLAGAKKCILHSHNSSLRKKTLHYMSRGIVNCFATDRFACSKAAGRWMFGKRKFRIINNGIETKRFSYNEAVRNCYRDKFEVSGKTVIGHIGRFAPEKNHKFLLDVFESYRALDEQSVLVLIGTGKLEREIKEYVSKKGLKEYVLFLGNRKDVAEIMQMFDVFVMPSLYEGFPVTLVEAQAAGLHCVVSDNITNEVNITKSINYLSLKSPMNDWAKAMLKAAEKERKDNSKIIMEAGFDIMHNVKFIEEMFADTE